jgi:hypothetical protein
MRWLILAVVLSSCATQPKPSPCLPMRAYTIAEQNALALAIGSIPGDNPVVGALTDYAALRAANREACK